jgi:hypothetical protein
MKYVQRSIPTESIPITELSMFSDAIIGEAIAIVFIVKSVYSKYGWGQDFFDPV